jgi:hypothetical protein
MEVPMSVEDLIIGLYIRGDDVMAETPKHPQAELYPSELVTSGLRFALKGESTRRFYIWLNQNHRKWFPRLPERTRLCRLLATPADWTACFLAHPTLLGVADTSGIELRHPGREDHADGQIGDKGLSHQRWIVGAKLGYVLNRYGLVVAWDDACANVADNACVALRRDFEDELVVLTDMAFRRAQGSPSNQPACTRGTWGVRMVVETVLSLLTSVCRLKKVTQRTGDGLKAHLAFTMALYTILVMWEGIPGDENGMIHLSMAQFVL